MANDRNNEPLTDPEDPENIVIDTTSTEPLREATIEEPVEPDSTREEDSGTAGRGKFIAPKFGSAGSGGAELEPGPDKGPRSA